MTDKLMCHRCSSERSFICRIRDNRADYFCLACMDAEWDEDHRSTDVWITPSKDKP